MSRVMRALPTALALIWIACTTLVVIQSLWPDAKEQILQMQLDAIDNPTAVEGAFHAHRAIDDAPSEVNEHDVLDEIEYQRAVGHLGLEEHERVGETGSGQVRSGQVYYSAEV